MPDAGLRSEMAEEQRPVGVSPAKLPDSGSRAQRLRQGSFGAMNSAAGVLQTAVHALAAWVRAMAIDGIGVAILWIIGLELLHVPLAPLWAIIAGLMAFIPNFGPVIALLGPVFSILLSGHDMIRLLYVLGWYALVVIVDQLLLQPVIMKRVTRVPIWVSLVAPIVLGILIPFWGVLLAPPLLAVVYAFRRPRTARRT